MFLGAKTWYRLSGFTSFRLEKNGSDFRLEQGAGTYYFPPAAGTEGMSELLYGFFEDYEEYIPGIKSVQIDMGLKQVQGSFDKRPEDLQTFSVRIQNNGGLLIIPEKNADSLH